MSASAPSKLANLGLIGVLCAAPVIASYFAYYFARTDAHTNHGELLEPRPLPEVQLQLVDGAAFQLSRVKGKWVLLMVDAGGCDDFCQHKLLTLRQLRLSQGKDMARIERVWLISDDVTPSAATAGAYPGTWLVRAAAGDFLKTLPAQGMAADHVYVIDPLGNLMMRYPRDFDPRGMVKDMARLLRRSKW